MIHRLAFSPGFYCGGGSGHVCCVALGRSPQRAGARLVSMLVCAASLRNLVRRLGGGEYSLLGRYNRQDVLCAVEVVLIFPHLLVLGKHFLGSGVILLVKVVHRTQFEVSLGVLSIGNCFWMPGREDNELMWKVSSILPSIGEASESGPLLELQTS